jgi:CubicO group peptidase (beta-lactamase class C family)
MKFRYWALLVLSGCGLADTIVTLNTAISNCPPLGAVLPPPKKPSTDAAVKAVLSQLEALQKEVSVQFGNASGLSLSIASAYEDDVLASLSYTPALYNTTGTHKVDGDTVFTIASVSKVFTVLGLLLLGDEINFSDPITKYVPELYRLKAEQRVQNRVTTIDWDLISIDALASQLGGVGNDRESKSKTKGIQSVDYRN